MGRPRDHSKIIAIVGAGLRLAGASDLGSLWRNLRSGKSFFREATLSDFGAPPSLFYQDGELLPDKAVSLKGAWLKEEKPKQGGEGPPQGGGGPLSGVGSDASQSGSPFPNWLAAGSDARGQISLRGHDPSEVGVIAGHIVLPTRAMSEATVSLWGKEATRSWDFNPFPPPPKDDPFRGPGRSASLLADRLGVSGESFTVDAACASSLYAMRLAMGRLIEGSLSCVFSGGLAEPDPLFTQLGFSQLRALSKSGASRPFDSRADGLVVGSGALCLALKRLDRAISDGDDILALILGVGLSNDQNANPLSPDKAGQLLAMGKAREEALKSFPGNDPPLELGLIEAHGTSTILGDSQEVASLKEFLSQKPYPYGLPVLGSVKGNLGHLLSAAGALSALKAALALRHKELPPTPGFESEAPGLDLMGPPALRVLKETLPWPEPREGFSRMALVNAFGFGGVNAQMVMEEWVPGRFQAPARQKAAAKGPGAAPQGASPDMVLGEDSGRKGAAQDAGGAPFLASPADAPEDGPGLSATLFAARTVLAPWPSYESLARHWLTPAEPPLVRSRRMGALKATGFFFEGLSLDARNLRLPPAELADSLPQQTLALKVMIHVLRAAGLDPANFPEGLDRDRLGVFMGVNTDPRASDYALRWLGPPRAEADLAKRGRLSFPGPLTAESPKEGGKDSQDGPRYGNALSGAGPDPADPLAGPPPPLTHPRVLGALGSFVASRLARWLRAGGPSFTVSEDKDPGLRALKEAMRFLAAGELDLALVGVVDTYGDPRTAALSPRTVWAEGAAGMLLGSAKVEGILTPLAKLTLKAGSFQAGPLSGLFQINRSGFYLRHHLKPLGRGQGLRYYLRDPKDPPREFAGPGYSLTEISGSKPRALTVPPDPIRPDTWFFVRADNPGDLKARLDQLEGLASEGRAPNEPLGPNEPWLLQARFHELQGGKGRPALAMLARSQHELLQTIKKALSGGEADKDPKPRLMKALPSPLQGKLALVFPGAGNHWKGLGRSLGLAFPQAVFELELESDEPRALFQPELFWEPGRRRPTPREGLLGQAMFGMLCQRVLSRLGIKAEASFGYSLGETTMLLAMGAWPDKDSLRDDLFNGPLFEGVLTQPYSAAREFLNWPQGKALKWVSGVCNRSRKSVLKAKERLIPSLRYRVYPLIANTKEECLIGGEESAVGALCKLMGATFLNVPEAPAMHCMAASPAEADYRAFCDRRTALPKDVTLYSSFNAAPLPDDGFAVSDSLVSQALEGHDFPRLVERAWKDGVRFFIEAGPGATVTRMIRAILGAKAHVAQSLAPTPAEEGWAGISRVVAELWLSGYPIEPENVLPKVQLPPPAGLLVPINLEPPRISWKEPPPKAISPKGRDPKAPPPAAGETDYMSWLGQEALRLKDQAKPDAQGMIPGIPEDVLPKTRQLPRFSDGSSAEGATMGEAMGETMGETIGETTMGQASGLASDQAIDPGQPAAAGDGTQPTDPADNFAQPPQDEISRKVMKDWLSQDRAFPGSQRGSSKPSWEKAVLEGKHPQRPQPPTFTDDPGMASKRPSWEKSLTQGNRIQFSQLPDAPDGAKASKPLSGSSDRPKYPLSGGPTIPARQRGSSSGPRPEGQKNLRTVEIPPNPRLASRLQGGRGRPRPMDPKDPRGSRDPSRRPDERDQRALESLFKKPTQGPGAAGPGPDGAPQNQVNGEAQNQANAPAQAVPQPVPQPIPNDPAQDTGPGQDPSESELSLAQKRRGRPKKVSFHEELGLSKEAISLTRAEALEFAGGRIGKVLGPDYAEIDGYPSRVRLPLEPLMLVDRVLGMDGVRLELGPGRAITEHDIRHGAWYIDQGHLTPGLAMESGQADLLLSAYLGIDFATQGKSLYRLLDAEVTYHRELPKPGETARYDIRIMRFFRHGDTRMFRFEFDGTINGEPLMAMRNGIAGFFTPEELRGGKGLNSGKPRTPDNELAFQPDLMVAPAKAGPLGGPALDALRKGDLTVLGKTMAAAWKDITPQTLPGGRLSLIDNLSALERKGGAYGRGFARAEAKVDPRAWFLTSHFLYDEVMPGTLMYDAALQTFRLYLFSLGWIPEAGRSWLLPAFDSPTSLRCRGQVTPETKEVAYDIHVRGLYLRPGATPQRPKKTPGRPPKPLMEPFAAADCVMWADGKPIAEVSNLAISFANCSLEDLMARFGRKPTPPARKTAKAEKAEKAEKTPKTAKAAKTEKTAKAKDKAKGKAGTPGRGRGRPRIIQDAGGENPDAGADASGSRGKAQAAGSNRPLPRIPQNPFLSEEGGKKPGALKAPPPLSSPLSFDKAGIQCLINGRVSDVFGKAFSRFDDGSFIARLPQAPYDFMDSALVTRGKVGEVQVGSELHASFTPDFSKWPQTEQGSNQGILPYPILNEIALQPCGFLASFMGSSLPFKGAMHFRNLGGQATIREPVGIGHDGPIETRVRLTKSSVLGATVIQHYGFECVDKGTGRPLFDGSTHFGFLSPENLKRQEGLKGFATNHNELVAAESLPFRPCLEGAIWPQGRFRMVDGLALARPLEGIANPYVAEPGIWGKYQVDPAAWFFDAHFPFDPVWPGSLGLEAFLQAAKTLAMWRYFPDISPEELGLSFQGPLPGITHKWLYRGQITPRAKQCMVGLSLTGESPDSQAFSFQGVLWVDRLPIYHVENFTVGQRAPR
ncbi:MAG: hypothetical protein LBF40_09220 [Deltaproteobacteria bacterium]|jgi:acyl transferase domain-containing protein/3-hydroxymyristoyl/3-hydroxydecanoyl-(acyl carrier protein) dehydratase|nr:hypothetical protein [Deltaproteobacteria bacterium]